MDAGNGSNRGSAWCGKCCSVGAVRCYGSTITWAPKTSPAPKPICSASPPLSSGFSSSRRWVARGMEAAEVLPASAMSRAILTVSGSLQLLGHLVDDAHVGLVRDERGEVLGRDAGGVQGLLGHLRHFPDRPAEDRLAVLAQGRPQRLRSVTAASSSLTASACACRSARVRGRPAWSGSCRSHPTCCRPSPTPRGRCRGCRRGR